MSKYIIDLRPDCKVVQQICVSDDNVGVGARSVELFDALTDEYVKENFKDLLEGEYQRGLEEGKKATYELVADASNAEYQKGFEDGKKATWEAARKIAEMWETIDNDELLGIFGLTAKIGESTIGTLFKKQTASEAIEKLKAYEEKQKADDKIEVGDEVEPFYTDVTGVVTLIDGDTIYILWRDGSSTSAMKLKEVTKTGRHFDIAKILEAMKND